MLILLHSGLHMALAEATSLAFAASLILNFGMNKAFVFRSNALVGPAFAKYLGLVALNFCTTLGMVTGLAALGVPYVAAKSVATCINAIMNYAAFRWWVFKTPSRGMLSVNSAHGPQPMPSTSGAAGRRSPSTGGVSKAVLHPDSQEP